jgi:hypothetical protein
MRLNELLQPPSSRTANSTPSAHTGFSLTGAAGQQLGAVQLERHSLRFSKTVRAMRLSQKTVESYAQGYVVDYEKIGDV